MHEQNVQAAFARYFEHYTHMFDDDLDCEQCLRERRMSAGRLRHQMRLRRWLRAKLGDARYEALEAAGIIE